MLQLPHQIFSTSRLGPNGRQRTTTWQYSQQLRVWTPKAACSNLSFQLCDFGQVHLLCLFPHLLGWWLWESSLSWKALWLMSNTNWPYSTFILSTCLVIQWLPKTKSVKGAFFLHRKSNTEILRKTSLSIKNSTYLTACTQNRKHTGPSLPASTVTFLHQMLYILSRTSVP